MFFHREESFTGCRIQCSASCFEPNVKERLDDILFIILSSSSGLISLIFFLYASLTKFSVNFTEDLALDLNVESEVKATIVFHLPGSIPEKPDNGQFDNVLDNMESK